MFPEYMALQLSITAVVILTLTRIRIQFHIFDLEVFILLCYLKKISFDMNNPAFRTGWYVVNKTNLYVLAVGRLSACKNHTCVL
jgi:hypothetical protein